MKEKGKGLLLLLLLSLICFWYIQWWQKVCYILFCLITPTNIGQISKPGSVLESACPEDSKTVTGS